MARAKPGDLPQLARGVRNTSRLVQLRMSSLETEMQERLKRAVDMVPQNATGVIVGVDAPANLERIAMFHWTGAEWHGHEHEYEWLTMEQLRDDWDSLDSDILHQAVAVTWLCNSGHHVYRGELLEQDENTPWYHLKYEDGDEEWINLSTLEVKAVHGHRLPGSFLLPFALC